MVKHNQGRWHQATSLVHALRSQRSLCHDLSKACSDCIGCLDQNLACDVFSKSFACWQAFEGWQCGYERLAHLAKSFRQKTFQGNSQSRQKAWNKKLKLIERMKGDGNLANEHKVRHCWLDSQRSSVSLPELVGMQLGVEARMLWTWKQFLKSSLENMPPTRAGAIAS